MLVINALGAPGVGKSTIAAGLFYKMKLVNLKVELVTEYAKDLTWDGRFNTLSNQPYVFGKQLDRLLKLAGKVDYVVTDSPLFLSAIYSNESETFNKFVLEKFNSFNNLNFYIRRTKPYQDYGRSQTEEESNEISLRIRNFILVNCVPVMIVDGNQQAVDTILDIMKYEKLLK